MAKTVYYYRTNKGPTGSVQVEALSAPIGLQRALNQIATDLTAKGWTQFADFQKRARYEGQMRVAGRKYPALNQGGIVVVAGVMPPAHWQIDF
jgi:hypothetical protein